MSDEERRRKLVGGFKDYQHRRPEIDYGDIQNYLLGAREQLAQAVEILTRSPLQEPFEITGIPEVDIFLLQLKVLPLFPLLPEQITQVQIGNRIFFRPGTKNTSRHLYEPWGIDQINQEMRKKFPKYWQDV